MLRINMESSKMARYVRVFISLLAGLLVFLRLGQILGTNYDGNQSMKGFYQMDRNRADVIFYGSSHVYAGVNVVDLWNDYGIAGYNLAGTMQPLWNTYYNMEETVKYQSPKMMVVDLYGLLIEEEYNGSTNVIKNVSSMRFSPNKVRNIWSSVPHEDFLSYLLSYPLTHDTYKELKRENYDGIIDGLGGQWFKGYRPSFAVTGYEELPQVQADAGERQPTEKNREYLDKITQFADEHQIGLAFIVVPYEGIDDADQMLYQWAEDYAGEKEIPFLNGNLYLQEMNFDPASDYAEASHLNHNGACKFTAYLGEWLKENCSFDDHRGDDGWDSWQRYSDCWAAWNQDQELKRCTNLEEYLAKVQSRKDYLVIVSLDDNYQKNPHVQLLEGMIGMDPYGMGSWATIVLQNQQLLYQTPNEPEYLWYMETERSDISVSRTYDGTMKVQVNRVDKNNSANDVTILVYDLTLDEIADVIAFNKDGVVHHISSGTDVQ